MRILLLVNCELNYLYIKYSPAACYTLFYCAHSIFDARLAYIQVNMTKRALPSDIMPRFHHLDEDGRSDLRRAISKFGGVKNIAKKANLIANMQQRSGSRTNYDRPHEN